jgi:hypothetical protein
VEEVVVVSEQQHEVSERVEEEEREGEGAVPETRPMKKLKKGIL